MQDRAVLRLTLRLDRMQAQQQPEAAAIAAVAFCAQPCSPALLRVETVTVHTRRVHECMIGTSQCGTV